MSSDHGKRVRWLLVASQRYYMYVFSKSNLNLLLRKLTTLLYVSPLFALIRSAIRLMSLSASLPIPPEVLNTAGVNIAFSPCSTQLHNLRNAPVPVGFSLWIEYPHMYEYLSQRGREIPCTYIKPSAGCCVGTVREFFASKE